MTKDEIFQSRKIQGNKRGGRKTFKRRFHYPNRLANVVMVKKPNGKWRICIDFTDLNTACPKDIFLFPRIDTFMDAYFGYNQIHMYLPDREKTSFFMNKGLYYYNVLPFGLKNVRATYQRLVNKMFHCLVGRNIEVYIDNMLVKSKKNERSYHRPR